jgi:hypothetical protein
MHGNMNVTFSAFKIRDCSRRDMALERLGELTSFLFIEKRIASSVYCKDAAFAARKYGKVDFV